MSIRPNHLERNRIHVHAGAVLKKPFFDSATNESGCKRPQQFPTFPCSRQRVGVQVEPEQVGQLVAEVVTVYDTFRSVVESDEDFLVYGLPSNLFYVNSSTIT